MPNQNSSLAGGFHESAKFPFGDRGLYESARSLLNIWREDPNLLKTPGEDAEKEILSRLEASTAILKGAFKILQESGTTQEDIKGFQTFINTQLPTVYSECHCKEICASQSMENFREAIKEIHDYYRPEVIRVDFGSRRAEALARKGKSLD